MGFWSRNVIFDRFCHFRTWTSFYFSLKNGSPLLPHKRFGCPRPNRSGFCESAKFSRFCTQFTDIYILPEFARFFNPFHKKTAARLSLFPSRPNFVKRRKKGTAAGRFLPVTVPFCNREIFYQIVKPLSYMGFFGVCFCREKIRSTNFLLQIFLRQSLFQYRAR